MSKINYKLTKSTYFAPFCLNKWALLKVPITSYLIFQCKFWFFSFLGGVYDDFVKFQNLIDLAYIEIISGEEGLLPDSVLTFKPSWVIFVTF